MTRNLRIERVFTLGQYKTLRVGDEYLDIPDELALDMEFVTHLRMLQILQLDEVYFKYVQNAPSMGDEMVTPEDALQIISEVKVHTLENLKQAIASVENAQNTTEEEGE